MMLHVLVTQELIQDGEVGHNSCLVDTTSRFLKKNEIKDETM